MDRERIAEALADCVTLGQYANRVNVVRSAVNNWDARFADFPKPVATIGKTRIYILAELDNWHESHKDGLAITNLTAERMIAAGWTPPPS